MLDGVDRGIHATNVYVVDLLIPNPERVFTVKKEEGLGGKQHMVEVISSLPAVQSVTFGGGVPGMLTSYEARIPPKMGETHEPISVVVLSADTAYLKMLGIRLLRGLYVKAGQSGSVVVNETFARRIWNRSDVTGEVFNLFGDQVQVVGAVRDAMYGHPSEKPEAIVFSPYIRISYEDRILINSTASVEQLRRQLQAKVDQGARSVNRRRILTRKWECLPRGNNILQRRSASNPSAGSHFCGETGGLRRVQQRGLPLEVALPDKGDYADSNRVNCREHMPVPRSAIWRLG